MVKYVFGAYLWEDYDTKKELVSVDIAVDQAMAISVDLSKKQAKALVKAINAALLEGK